MRRNTQLTMLAIACWLLLGGIASAQEDNTGTNPVNFTYDFRLFTEMASLPSDDSSLITSTIEFRWPFGRDIANLKGVGAGSRYHDMGRRWGMRIRARHSNLSVDVPGAGTYSVSGIGDFDARLLYLPYVGKKSILAVGLVLRIAHAQVPAALEERPPVRRERLDQGDEVRRRDVGDATGVQVRRVGDAGERRVAAVRAAGDADPVPVDETDVDQVVDAVCFLRDANLEIKLHAYGTNIEGEWDDVFAAVKRCHEVLHEMGAPRVSAVLKMGTRTDRDQSMDDKIKSVEDKL